MSESPLNHSSVVPRSSLYADGRDPPISFRDAYMESLVALRTRRGEGRGRTAKRDLERYYFLLQAEEASLSVFTSAELTFLRLTLEPGDAVPVEKALLLWARVQALLQTVPPETRAALDPDRLVQKLKGLSPVGLFTLFDQLERWWVAQ